MVRSRRFLPAFLLLFALLLGSVSSIRGQAALRRPSLAQIRQASARRMAALHRQLIVKYAPQTAPAARSALAARAGARVLGRIPQLDVETVDLPNPAAARALASSPGVLWTEPNLPRRVLLPAPNDPAYSQLDIQLPVDGDPTWFEWDAHQLN